MSPRGMIVSVGRSLEPVRKTLDEGRPPYVLFVVSSGSKPHVEKEILPALPSYAPQRNYLEISDHEDIGTCYWEIRADVERWLHERELKPEEVYVDITGGTKAMSAALALAGVERFRNFTYVGGCRRNSGNLGTVVTGSERVIERQNPWNAYAVREMERANWLLSEFHADSAAEILEAAAEKCDPSSQKARLMVFVGLSKALGASDKFDFLTADKQFSPLREKLKLSLDYDYAGYEKLEALHEQWQTIREQVKDNNRTAGRETLLELLANADRRAKQSRFDDAVGRLYRAVELRGQQLVKQAFGAELGKISIEQFPADRRENVIAEFGAAENDNYGLGVKKLFQALEFSEVESLREKAHIYGSLKNDLQKRNNSLLAHGLRRVTQRDFKSFWSSALQALGLHESDIPHWPHLELKLPS